MYRRRSTRLWLCLAALAAALAMPASAQASPSAGPPRPVPPPPGRPAPVPSRHVCPGPVARGSADCGSRVVTDGAGTPLATTAPTGLGPAQLHGAYELPATAASPQTVAIVDAYDDPTIEEDLAVYGETYGLPACTTANGCFRKVNQEGHEGPYPKADSGWSLEIALDVETVHAICQDCHILLVEASSNAFSDLRAAVNEAAALGADEISNSYGGGEFASEATDTAYDHPGVVVTASAGDGGYGAEYPAASPYVVAVGGTTLALTAGNGYGGETVWSGSGSGCSAFVTAQPWQTADPGWAATGCGTARGIADVSADADPASGASVYDTTRYKGQEGWFRIGGTSLSAPLVAAVYALAGGASSEYPAADPYTHQDDSPPSLHDVTSGSNGSCGGTSICEAGPGYDGPTGVGTPKGIAAFGPAAPPPPPPMYRLTASKEGSGQGWVHSDAPEYAINCGGPCTTKSAEFEAGAVVHLFASGSQFAGWTSCPGTIGGRGDRECTVTMDAAKEATARFLAIYLLTATKTGTGTGWVHSEAPEYTINCGGPCTTKSAYFEAGTVVLTASGSQFVEWTSCPGTIGGRGDRECAVDLVADETATAEFTE